MMFFQNETAIRQRSERTGLACIAHYVGRIKSATDAGTAQTWIPRRDTLSHRSGFDWRMPLRLSLGLLGPAYKPVRNTG